MRDEKIETRRDKEVLFEVCAEDMGIIDRESV
jgi:hypothetical protein